RTRQPPTTPRRPQPLRPHVRHPTRPRTGAVNNRSWYVLRRVLPYAWRRRAALALVAVGMLLDIGLTVLQPGALQGIADNVPGGQPLHGFANTVFHALPGPHGRDALLTWSVLAGIAIFVLTWGASLLAAWAAIRFGSQLSYDMAGDLFAHMQRLSLRFHAQH